MADEAPDRRAELRRIHAELDLARKGDFDEIGALGAAAGAMRKVLAELREVRAAIAEATGERSGVTQRQIDALVALGVLGVVSSGGIQQLVWMHDGVPSRPAPMHLVATETGTPGEDVDREVFRLDIAIDLETERLLLYRVSLVAIVVIGMIIARQLLIGVA